MTRADVGEIAVLFGLRLDCRAAAASDAAASDATASDAAGFEDWISPCGSLQAVESTLTEMEKTA